MEIVRFLDLINRTDQVSLAYIQQYLALNSHTFASYFCREAFIESVEFEDEKENKESEWGVREGADRAVVVRPASLSAKIIAFERFECHERENK